MTVKPNDKPELQNDWQFKTISLCPVIAMIDAQYPTVTTPKQTAQKPDPRRFWRAAFILKISIAVLCAVFFIGFAIFTSKITRMSQLETIAPADAIVVLTGGTDRLKPAIELLKKGSGKKLLISGVNPETTKKELISAYDVTADLSECCIDLDQVAINTVSNATQSAKWLRANNFKSVILVTSNYHMPRAEKELHRLSGAVKITPFPLVNSDLRNWKWLEQPDAFRLILTEYLKFTLTSVRHLIAPEPNKGDLARVSG
jgi:uncharacterized SAM-binding protein YcdF (DUF218 family)